MMRVIVITIGMMALVSACAEEPAPTYQARPTVVETPKTLTTNLPAASDADLRWRYVGSGIRWDTTTISRTGNVATVWYEASFLEAQRRHLRPTLGNVVDEIARGRYHTSINCADKRYALLAVAWLDAQGTPVVPPVVVDRTKASWDSIAPETNMEGLLQSVCRRTRA